MPAQAASTQPLSDVMLAMDVVDTLRHQQLLIDRELNSEDRDRKLIERLRATYASQGIEVPDAILEQGVAALKEDRFAYEPAAPSLQTRVAGWYTRRDRWAKPVLLVSLLLVLATLAYFLLVRGPQQRELTALPNQLQAYHQRLLDTAQGSAAKERSEALFNQGDAARRAGDDGQLKAVLQDMQALQAELDLEYDLRIISRPGENSGVWRIPDANTNARNYYVIVEAIGADGKPLTRSIVNEEDGQSYQVDKWGMRVEQRVYDRVAADKQDDGIIQQSRFGSKRRGYLAPEYLVATSGGSITAW